MIRIGLIAGVLVLTGLTFLFAGWSLSDDLTRDVEPVAVVDTQEADSLRVQLSALEAANDSSRSEIDSLTQTNAALTEQVAELQTVATNAASGSDEVSALADTNAALTSQIADLQSQIENAASNTAESDQTVATLTAEIAAATEAKQAIEAQLAEANAEVETLQQRAIELESETAALSQNSTDQTIALRAEVDALNAELESSNGRVASLTTEAEQNADLVVDLTAQVETAQSEVTTLSDQVAQLSTDLDAATAEANVAAEALAVAESEAAAAIATAATAAAAATEQPAAPAEASAGPTQTLSFCNERSLAAFRGQKIDFESESATLTAGASAALESFAEVAQRCTQSGHMLVISSHTDGRGPAQSNLALSQSRADAVVAFLTESGLPGDALQGVGFGEEAPIASNGTIEGRAENRRVTLEWQ